MESNDQAQSYAVDDKVSKMKEHWEIVCRKVEELRSNFETVVGMIDLTLALRERLYSNMVVSLELFLVILVEFWD